MKKHEIKVFIDAEKFQKLNKKLKNATAKEDALVLLIWTNDYA